MSRRRRGLTAGTGLVLATGSCPCGQNWSLIGVGLVLGAAAEGIGARRRR